MAFEFAFGSRLLGLVQQYHDNFQELEWLFELCHVLSFGFWFGFWSIGCFAWFAMNDKFCIVTAKGYDRGNTVRSYPRSNKVSLGVGLGFGLSACCWMFVSLCACMSVYAFASSELHKLSIGSSWNLTATLAPRSSTTNRQSMQLADICSPVRFCF